ncbi:MAG: YicC/YloC family endoribonuclease [Pseudomonadota bacterium]
MTGFASGRGTFESYAWQWEMRSVNGRGLDVRMRVPDWIQGLETSLRGQVASVAKRGNVTLSLRVTRTDDVSELTLNATNLAAVLAAVEQVEAEAMQQGVSLAPSRATDVLAVRGVLDAGGQDTDTGPLLAALQADFRAIATSFADMRAKEGRALVHILNQQLNDVAQMVETAAELAAARKPKVAETLNANLEKVLGTIDQVDPDRLAQELAMLAVKADVTEEIDRLKAHVGSARALLDAGGPVGRKLDFLMQEFNREANTLCSKSQSTELTAVGLDLKAVIDQMREQVQNVE